MLRGSLNLVSGLHTTSFRSSKAHLVELATPHAGGDGGSSREREEDTRPAELRLKESDDVIAKCAARLRGSRLLRWSCQRKTHALYEKLRSTADEPNWALVMWCMAVYQEEAEAAELHRSVAPALASALVAPPLASAHSREAEADAISSQKRRKRNRRRVYLILGALVPCVQAYLMTYTVWHLSCFVDHLECQVGDRPGPRTFTRADMCVEATLGSVGETADLAMEVLCNLLMFSFSLLQARQATLEWDVIAFIASLSYDFVANSVVILGCMLDTWSTFVYSFALYLLVSDNPSIIDVLFNILALEFIFEIDNALSVLLLSRERAVAAKIIEGFAEHATLDDLIIYRAAPRANWHAFGWHRAGPSKWVWAPFYVLGFMQWMILALRLLLYGLLAFCFDIEYTGLWATNATESVAAPS